MTDDDTISPYLAEIENAVATEAASNPNNAVSFNMESETNSVVNAVKIKETDYDKYLTSSQRSSLPKHLQEGIVRKKKTQEAEDADLPSFESLREENDVPTVPEDAAEPDMEETPEPGFEEPDIGPSETDGPESPPDESLPRPEPVEVDFLAERLNNQEQEMKIASMTQKQFEDWLFPDEKESEDWASGQITLARIMANLKAAGYDSGSLSLDEQLYPAYVQIASSLWSRQNLSNPVRTEVLAQIENAPASQLVATLEATARAVPTELAAELFRPIGPTNYLPYVGLIIATLGAISIPFFWKR